MFQLPSIFFEEMFVNKKVSVKKVSEKKESVKKVSEISFNDITL